MKSIILIALYGVILCYPFYTYKDIFSPLFQSSEYLFFFRKENIFNNNQLKNKFLQLFFSEKEIEKFKNSSVCLVQKDILEKNNNVSFAESDRLKRYLNAGCTKTGEYVLKFSHPRWKDFLYKSFDGKRLCKVNSDCGILLEDDANQIVVGWDNHGVEVYSKENDQYNYANSDYDLSKKYPELTKEYLNSFVEIRIPTGGLGNQLFGYWSGIIYALKNNKKPLYYDRSYIEDYLILPFKTTEKPKFQYDKKPGYIQRYVNKFAGNGSSHHDINEKGNFIYLNGYSQSWRNFVGYEDYIRENTVFKYPMLEKSREISQKMQRENSVSIHVRRGDYVSQGYILLTQNYYNQAVSYMKANLDNPHFYIFSNDIDWVRKNLKIDAPYTIVDWNNKDYQDLQLMSYCKNHIIANSTFSWWGAFLSKNKNKIVIAPNKHVSWNLDWIKPTLAPDFVVIDVETHYWDSRKKEFITK